jgi:hypothetical protein
LPGAAGRGAAGATEAALAAGAEAVAAAGKGALDGAAEDTATELPAGDWHAAVKARARRGRAVFTS